MGFEFKSEQERNPVQQPPSHEELLLKKLIDSNEDDKAELEMMTNFLQDNGYIMLYDNYKEIIKERERIAKLEETSNGFEQA
jgi:hypothetical protein